MTLENLKKKIIPVLKEHKITRAGIFGSYARNENQSSSDIDILVELASHFSLLDFVRVKIELEERLKRKVDLVEYQAIKPKLKERILSEEVRIYG